MINLCEKQTAAFVVPTGVGASIGGFAGDASSWARKFAKERKVRYLECNTLKDSNVIKSFFKESLAIVMKEHPEMGKYYIIDL